MLDELWCFILGWLFVVGGVALFFFTIRVLAWLADVILLGGW